MSPSDSVGGQPSPPPLRAPVVHQRARETDVEMPLALEAPERPVLVDERVAGIYAREADRVAALARMLLGDVQAGEDLAQDVFLVALRRCRDDPDYLREPVWPWLRMVTVNLASKRRRQLGRELRRLMHVASRPVHEEWPEPASNAMAALASLPPRMRACVVLFYVEDLSSSDVAHTMGCSLRTVETQLRAARARLRAVLRPMEDE